MHSVGFKFFVLLFKFISRKSLHKYIVVPGFNIYYVYIYMRNIQMMNKFLTGEFVDHFILKIVNRIHSDLIKSSLEIEQCTI